VINQVGQPIGAFFGYQADGLFRDATRDVAAPRQAGRRRPGRIKFRDVNGDGQITLADRTVIGSPHPDFTGGLDGRCAAALGPGATLFGTFGNEIFDAQKEFYVFRNFSTNVRADRLANSWTPENPNAKYPRLDVNDTFSRSSAASTSRTARTSGCATCSSATPCRRRCALAPNGARVYLQGENLFTLTGYDGLDPALPPRRRDRAGRRHPRPVPRRRPGVVPEQPHVQPSAS
jgi:hypothetical protein